MYRYISGYICLCKKEIKKVDTKLILVIVFFNCFERSLKLNLIFKFAAELAVHEPR